MWEFCRDVCDVVKVKFHAILKRNQHEDPETLSHEDHVEACGELEDVIVWSSYTVLSLQAAVS